MELLVVVALIGIVSLFVVGSFRRFQARALGKASMEDLLVALQRARSDAVARDHRSGVLVAPDTANVFQDGNGVSRQGIKYLRFVDSDVGTVGAFDSNDTVLQAWTSLGNKVFVRSIASSGLSAGATNLVFHTDGSTDNDLSLVLGLADFAETFRIGLLPATGLATLER